MSRKYRLKIHWAWIILISSFSTLFINYGIRIGAYSVLLPKMIEDLGLSMTQAGMIRASYFLTYIIFSPLMGWLSDRIGGRFVISFFCLFLGTGSFLMGHASNLITAIMFHGIVGIGAAAMWTPIATLIQKWFGEKKRGLVLGILSPSWPLGYGSMGLLLPFIVKIYGWRTGWILLGTSCWFLMVLNAFLLKNDPKGIGLAPWGEALPSNSSPPLSTFNLNFWNIIRGRNFWLIGASYFFIAIGAYIFTDLIVTYGVIELKIDYPVASAFITIMAITGIIGGFTLMSLSDYIGRRRSILLIQSLVGLSILLLLFSKDQLFYLRTAIGFFGFLYGAIWPMYAACVRDYFPEAIAGTIIGVLTLFYGIGAIIGPIMGGLLTDFTGSFRWAFGLGAFTAFISALLIEFLGKPSTFQRGGD